MEGITCKNRFWKLLLIVGAVFCFLKWIVPLTAPFLAALLFVTMFGSTLQRLEAICKIPRQIGAVLLLLLAGGFLTGLLLILGYWILGSIPDWMKEGEAFFSYLVELIHQMSEQAEKLLGVDAAYVEERILFDLEEGFGTLRETYLPEMFSKSLTWVGMFVRVGGFVIAFLISVVLLAKDYDGFMNKLFEQEEYHMILQMLCDIIRYLATFLRAQLVIMTAIGTTAAVLLGISGIRHGILWGLAAGLLDALPFVGTGIILIPLSMVQLFSGQYKRFVFCIAAYILCVFLRELMEPRLIGKRVGIPPVAVLLSIYGGIKLFGGFGILAGPLGLMMILSLKSN